MEANGVTPTLEEARSLAAGYTLLPLGMELFSDVKTPIEILRSMRRGNERVYILESVESGENWGRYTFLGYKPSLEIYGRSDTVTFASTEGEKTRRGNPQEILKGLAAEYRSPRIGGMPPFTGGFVGYFAYEYIRNAEPTLKLAEEDDIGLDDFRLMLFDRVVAIDHFRQKMHLIVNIGTEGLEKSYASGVDALEEMRALVLGRGDCEEEPCGLTTPFAATFTKERYCEAVERVKRHIYEGDIFQCVPSNRLTAGYKGDLLPLYRILRTTNPSAYMFYLRLGGLEIAGASPETLVSLKDGVLSTYPLAGSCPRGADDEETERLTAGLLRDPKELSEHDMLVDLGRNDLGKICSFGSVRVAEYRKIKKFSHICHIASKVTGLMAEGRDAFDAIAAVLPAGTLSGAPKLRACEIIGELEGVKRGVYGGAVGYIDFAGNMDMCIGIRMAVLKDGCVHVQAGGGVVADSVPEKEYREIVNKAGAVVEALERVGKGAV